MPWRSWHKTSKALSTLYGSGGATLVQKPAISLKAERGQFLADFFGQ